MELAERLRRLALAAAELVRPGMTVGLGTGSTADALIRELGHRASAGLAFTGVATSDRTERLARELGISLTTLDDVDRLEIGFDGADEIDPNLDAIKGRGGALLREKLVALSCETYILMATTEKNVSHLGERNPVPVEIVRFGWRQTAQRLAALGTSPTRRGMAGDPDQPWLTDGGGFILDCETGPIEHPRLLAAEIKATAGVVEHGLFLSIANMALQVDTEGDVIRRDRPVS